MKKVLYFAFTAIIFCALRTFSMSQVVISQFDFNGPLYQATIGPDAINMDPDTVERSGAACISGNCAPLKGIDLEVPNSDSRFDMASIGMVFHFRRKESQANFFVRGGTEFYMNGGQLMIRYRTSDGAGGYVNYGPVNTGRVLPSDDAFHTYEFVYDAASGTAIVKMDGLIVWSYDGADDRPLYWDGAGNPVIGSLMDGNCSGDGFLDYAYIYDPTVSLPVDFLSFEARPKNGTVELNWNVANEAQGIAYTVERSLDGSTFEAIGGLPATGETGRQRYTFTDNAPEAHAWYRIRFSDREGGDILSELAEVAVEKEAITLRAWPNPAKDRLHVALNTNESATLTLLDPNANVVLHREMTAGQASLDLRGIAQGMYLLRVTSGGRQEVRRIIVQ